MAQVGKERGCVVVGGQEKSIAVGVVSPPGVGGVLGSDADQLGLQLHLPASSQSGSCQLGLDLGDSGLVSEFLFGEFRFFLFLALLTFFAFGLLDFAFSLNSTIYTGLMSASSLASPYSSFCVSSFFSSLLLLPSISLLLYSARLSCYL